MSTGYANRVIHLAFPELAEPELKDGQPVIDPETGKPVPSERIWVTIRNPRLMPPGELTPRDVPLDPATGAPLRADDANEAMYEIFSKLIVGWRAYDATDFSIDPETGEALPQRLLELPATVDNVRKLPTAIVNRIAEQMTESSNPS